MVKTTAPIILLLWTVFLALSCQEKTDAPEPGNKQKAARSLPPDAAAAWEGGN